MANLTGERGRFVILVLFVILLCLTGGASRHDVSTLLVLRPLSIVFAAYAFVVMRGAQARSVLGPLVIVFAMMALAIAQLVPLPPGVWQGLPQREAIAEAGSILGMGDIWRPLSLDPNRTWNAFFALFAPLAAIALVAVQDSARLRWIVPMLFAVAFLSLLLGVLQLIGDRAFYFYEITNIGRPVGFFSNRNHQGVLFAWMIPAMIWSVLALRKDGKLGAATLVVCAIGYLLLLLMISLSGSRAALLLALPASAIAGWLVLRPEGARGRFDRFSNRAMLAIKGGAVALLLLLVVIIALVLTWGDGAAAGRFFAEDSVDDLRTRILPILNQMATTFFPWGSGLGSFDSVFRMFEAQDQLSARYVNQAHNDLWQIIIEGGLAAALILAGGLAWLIRAAIRVWRGRRSGARATALFLAGSIALFLAASVVDYPLRTPLGASFVAILTAMLGRLSTSGSALSFGNPDKRRESGRR